MSHEHLLKIAVCWALILNGYCSLIQKQSRLTTELFETRNYDPKVRPSKLYSDTVLVKFKLFLNQILDVVSYF